MKPQCTLAMFVLLSAACTPLAAATSAGESAPMRRWTPDELRADFDELYVRLRDSHYDLYARRTRREYDALHARMRASFGAPMSAEEAAVAFQPFLAFGRIAHARIDSAGGAFARHRAAGGRLFPLDLRVVDERVFVTASLGDVEAIRPGDELRSVDSEPALHWLDRMTAPLSADTPYMARTMQEWSLRRLVFLALGAPAAVDVQVRHANGAESRLRLPFRTQPQLDAARERHPPAFELSWEAREHRVLEDVGYLRPGPFYESDPNAPDAWDPRSFSSFVDAAFREFATARVRAVVVDLRDNPGGDNSFSDRLLAWFAARPFRFASSFRIRVSAAAIESNRRRMALPGGDPTGIGAALERAYSGRRLGEYVEFPVPTVQPRAGERFAGRIVVLVNRHTYSNAVAVAATVQDYGFGTILGEETSDLATTYGAMEEFALGRTGVKVGFPKARIVRPSGSRVERGVVPDVPIPTPVVTGRDDAVLTAALRWLRAERVR